MERSFNEILENAKCGDIKDREYIIKKYQPLIYKKSNLFFIRDYDEEDLFQIARMMTLKAIDSYEKERAGNFTVYLDRIIMNNFSNMLRGISNRNNELSLDYEIEKEHDIYNVVASDELVENIIEKRQLYCFVKNALDRLSIEERNIIKFLYFDGGNLRKLAVKKNESYSKIRRKRNKILLKIKGYLSEDGVQEFNL